MARPSVWVVSPELHRRGGTERAVAEQVERWRSRFNLRVYSMAASDVDLTGVDFRVVRGVRGPHLVRYIWWFGANRVLRVWDERRSGRPDAVVSPGINASDADAIGVHIVFAKYWERVRADLVGTLRGQPGWLRGWHRMAYVGLIRTLERRVYGGPPVLWSVSAEDAREIESRFGRPAGSVPAIPYGVDTDTFDPKRRRAERAEAREALGLRDERVVLLVGNDEWKKGVDLAVAAVRRLPDDVVLAVAGRIAEDRVRTMAGELDRAGRIRVWPHRSDPFPYYAAADVLAAPSREDSFHLPAVEAMASGLPVVVSRAAGVSELVEDGQDAVVVRDPKDATELAAAIDRALDPEIAARLSSDGRTLAEQTGWDVHADRSAELLMREIRTPRSLVLAADPFGVGGIERVSRTLIRALAERYGADRVGVVSLRGGRGDLPARVLYRGRTSASPGAVTLADQVGFTLSALGHARRWRRRLVVVACHPHLAPVALAAGRLSGAPVAVWCHGYEVWRPLRPIVRMALRRADLVFAPSRFTADQVRRWAGLELDPVVIPHAVPDGFDAAKARRRVVEGRVLAVARMEAHDRGKGIDVLLRAWPKIAASRPEAELLVVGDGADRNRLERAARATASNGRVRFLGRLDDPALRELYRTAAVFALPTRARVGSDAAGEGFGLVFVEAAAAGVPVVAGRSGAVPEVVEDGKTGLLVEPNDSDAVAEAIGTLLDDPKLRATMARAARARVMRRYSAAAFGDRVAEVLGGLVRVYPRDTGTQSNTRSATEKAY